jgi:hypothetical protein
VLVSGEPDCFHVARAEHEIKKGFIAQLNG